MVKNLSDEKLVVHIRTKNSEAYREVMFRYQEKLLRYVQTVVGDADDGADVVQNTFIKAFKNLHSFDEKRKFSSWIYRIAHNESVNHLRKKKWLFSLQESWAHDLPDDKLEIEDNFFQQQEEANLYQAIDSLPVKYRSPILLHLEGQKYEEIAEVLRIQSKTVATQIRRAKQQLKKILINSKNIK